MIFHNIMITGLLNLQITPDMLFLHADTDKFLTMTEYKSEKSDRVTTISVACSVSLHSISHTIVSSVLYKNGD